MLCFWQGQNGPAAVEKYIAVPQEELSAVIQPRNLIFRFVPKIIFGAWTYTLVLQFLKGLVSGPLSDIKIQGCLGSLHKMAQYVHTDNLHTPSCVCILPWDYAEYHRTVSVLCKQLPLDVSEVTTGKNVREYLVSSTFGKMFWIHWCGMCRSTRLVYVYPPVLMAALQWPKGGNSIGVHEQMNR